jgi:hypothetical protein
MKKPHLKLEAPTTDGSPRSKRRGNYFIRRTRVIEEE